MPSIECAICSLEFGKRNDSSDVCVTECGHVFHVVCLSKWLEYGAKDQEPKSCPDCRQSVTMQQTRRIYFNFSSIIDNMQEYIDSLNSTIVIVQNKLHVTNTKLKEINSDWSDKLRKKELEIQGLKEKYKHLEQGFEVQKLHVKIEKLKSKLRESKHKPCATCRVNVSAVPLNENMFNQTTQFNATESLNPMRPMQPANCDASTSIFSQNVYTGQSSGTSTTIQNPFECDISTLNSNFRSIRNPLSTFASSYQPQNGYMSSNSMQAFSAMMTPSIQSAHTSQTTQQQSFSYNQTSYHFLPIQTTNSINAAYFNSNDPNQFVGQ